MADASDSKSDAGNSVWVQVPSPASDLMNFRVYKVFFYGGQGMDRERMVVELYLIHTEFLNDEHIFHRKLHQVSDKRRKKVLECKTREDKKRSLAAGLLLEEILKSKGYSPEQVEMDKAGKLYLPGVDDFFFSLSHSGEYAACGVCDVPVGVDIQKKRETKANIARRFFCRQEAERIERQPKEMRADMFFRYWTGKESYLKLTGQGIFAGMDNFLVDLEEKRIVDPDNDTKEIYLKEYRCLADYFISVACYSQNFAAFVKKIYYRL